MLSTVKGAVKFVWFCNCATPNLKDYEMKKITIRVAVFLSAIYFAYLGWSTLATNKEISTIDAIKAFTIACADDSNFSGCEKFYQENVPAIFKGKGKTPFLNGITNEFFESKHKQLIIKGAKIQSLENLKAIGN
jgi:hypothetical protein